MLHDTKRRLPPEFNGGFFATFERLQRFARARGVPRDEAADLAQEAIARSLIHLRRHGWTHEEDGIQRLLFRIAGNLLVDRARARSVSVVPLDGHDRELTGADPSEEFDRAAARMAVRAAIGELSGRHRRALMMVLEGKTPVEIAEAFGIERNAADALLYRARRRLADRIRVASEIAIGLAALAALRVRAGTRRVAEMMRSAEVAGPGFVQAATAAFTAVILFAGSAAPVVAAVDRPERFPPVTDAALSAARAHLLGSVGPGPDAPRVDARSASADRVEVSTSVTNPVTGDEHRAGTRVRHEPGSDGERGVTGEVVHNALVTACALAPSVCGEGQ